MRSLLISFATKVYSIRVSHVHLKANFTTKFGAIRMQSEFGPLYV